MEHVIIEVNDVLIKVEKSKLDSPEFDVETNDFQIQFICNDGELHVSNACDGWGRNRRSDFLGKKVTLYK